MDKPFSVETLSRLCVAANGNKKKVSELRAYMTEHADSLSKIHLTDYFVRNALIGKLAEGDGTSTLFHQECVNMKKSLKREDDSEVERLLIERIALCWLRLQAAENYATLLMNQACSLSQAEHASKEITRAQARLTRACESLERVRAMRAATDAIRARAEAKSESKPAQLKLAG
jgi:hypothetical protein